MREIILDTETTGLDHTSGDRIVEIGGVELLNLIWSEAMRLPAQIAKDQHEQ